MDKERSAYWKDHYNDSRIVGTDSPQRNVERTKGGNPISKEIWEQTLQHIKTVIGLKKSDTVIELCCGNGMVIGPLSSMCKKAIGIDYSAELLRQLNKQFPNRVDTIHSDVLSATMEENSVDIVIIYFSIQMFNDADAVRLIEKSFQSLRLGGRLFIGDIPNDLKKWDYVELPEHRKDYILRLVGNNPMIGNWFQPLFFSAVADYLGNASVELLEQPEYLINSECRFDVCITKV